MLNEGLCYCNLGCDSLLPPFNELRKNDFMYRGIRDVAHALKLRTTNGCPMTQAFGSGFGAARHMSTSFELGSLFRLFAFCFCRI